MNLILQVMQAEPVCGPHFEKSLLNFSLPVLERLKLVRFGRWMPLSIPSLTRCKAGEYQEDEQAGVARICWREGPVLGTC